MMPEGTVSQWRRHEGIPGKRAFGLPDLVPVKWNKEDGPVASLAIASIVVRIKEILLSSGGSAAHGE